MIKTFTCKICGETFQKETRSYAYYCPTCFKEQRRQASYRCAVKKGRIKCPGVGRGGNQLGENNPMWSNYKGEYSYRNLIKIMNECQMCGSKEHLCRHHINFIRSDNRLENLIIVCRSCHAKLHKLEKNISRIKTTLNGGSTQDNPVPSVNDTGRTTIPDECKGVDSSESKDVAPVMEKI